MTKAEQQQILDALNLIENFGDAWWDTNDCGCAGGPVSLDVGGAIFTYQSSTSTWIVSKDSNA